MSTIIKLQRRGSPHKPFWRIVVTDSRHPLASVAQLGTYDNHKQPAVLHVDAAQAALWLSRGALPTPTVKKLLARQGIKPAPAATGKAGQ